MMDRIIGVYLPVIIFALTIGALIFYNDMVGTLASKITEVGVVGYLAYVAILVVAVVAMPITVMPLIPMAAAALGPLPTALLSIVGWTLGGAIAFLVARHVARPIVERFVSLERVDAITDRIPSETRFLSIVLLRLTLPVDVVSYALGLSKTVGFWEYLAATVIGVTWFSFAFAYMGDALLNHDTILFIELGAASILVFILGWLVLTRKNKRRRVDK